MSTKRNTGAKKPAKESIVRKFRQCLRIRPLMDNEKNENQKKDSITNARSAVEYNDGEIYLMDPKGLTVPKPMIKPTIKKKYTQIADEVFWSFGQDPWTAENREKSNLEQGDYDHAYADNNDVYDSIKGDIVPMLYEGYNQTVACYGPTNGGKTFTLFGTEKNPGIAPRLIKDVLAALQSQTADRQAPGEVLTITVDCQCLRVYKEEIEDLNHGFPRPPLKGDGAKIGVGEIENATKIRLNDPSNLQGFIERISGKEGVRKPSSITAPNKHNRSTVIVLVTVTQTSKFQGEERETETSKSSTLTFADIGHGVKADNETPVEYKKISQAQGTFGQVIRKLGDKGLEWAAAEEADKRMGGTGNVTVTSKAHIPFNTSVMTRILAAALGESHVTLICCISPYHKQHSDTQSWLEMCDYGNKARGIATPNEGKDLAEFREKLEEKEKISKEMIQQSAAVTRVKEELEGRQVAINKLKREIAEGESDAGRIQNDVTCIQEKLNELSRRLTEQRKSSKQFLAYLDRREATALGDKKEADRKMAELKANLAENERKNASQEAQIAQAGDLLKRAAGLNALLTGKPVHTDNLFAEGGDYNEGLNFDTEAAEATRKLTDAISKYEKVVNMNDENNRLLEEIQQVLTKAEDVEEDKAKTHAVATRYKRKCVKEIITAIDELVRGTAHADGQLKQLNELTNRYTALPEKVAAAQFYLEESTGITKVLGSALLASPTEANKLRPSEREMESAPGWCKWKNVVPIRPWIGSLTSKSDKTELGGSFGASTSNGKQDGDGKYRVEDISNNEIQSMYDLVMNNQAWCDRLLHYNMTREAIEAAYQEWFAKMPKWPKTATDSLRILKAAKDQDSRVEGLKNDIAQLNSDITKHQKELADGQGQVTKLEAQKKQCQEALKKEQDKCIIL